MNYNYPFKKSVLIGIIIILTSTHYLYAIMPYQKEDDKDEFFEKWTTKAKNSKGFSPSAKKRSFEDMNILADSKSKNSNVKSAQVGTISKLSDIKTKDIKKTDVNIQKNELISERPLPKSKISMRMHETEIPVLLRALARAANQNIIINDGVKGKTNININNAPWDEVFSGILKTHGLTYKWEGNIIRIVTMQDLKQEIDILKAKQQLDIERLEFEEKLKVKNRDSELIEPLITKLIPIDFADAGNLRENLEKFLTLNKEGKARGSVTVDKFTNSLIVQATINDIKKMLLIISELDAPTPQVLIEAHVVEANKETAMELGVQWGGLYKGYEGGSRQWITPSTSTGLNGTTFFNSTGAPNQGINPTSGMGITLPTGIVSNLGGASLNYVYESIGKSMLIMQLSALQKEGKVNILSSPSITTMDNQKAIIQSGKQVPYQTVENGEVKIQYKDAIVKLEVIPNVIDDTTLKLEIITNKDELSDSMVQGNPIILTKKAETKVLLLDGQTTVIGGLNKETGSYSEAGVPFLKSIPIIGNLFKGTNRKNQMEELLIFITPHILKEQKMGDEIKGDNKEKKQQAAQEKAIPPLPKPKEVLPLPNNK